MNHNHTIEQLRALRLTGMAEAFAHQMTRFGVRELRVRATRADDGRSRGCAAR
jgi:hypothetical protein